MSLRRKPNPVKPNEVAVPASPADVLTRLANLEQVIDGNNRIFIDSLHTVEMWLTVIRMYMEDMLADSTKHGSSIDLYERVESRKVGEVYSVDWDAYVKRYQVELERAQPEEPVDKMDKPSEEMVYDPTTYIFGGDAL